MKPTKIVHSTKQINLFIILSAVILLLTSSMCFGATYYVDATNGNDSNNGLLASTAWKTIAKVNNSIFIPGDYILFKKGEIWREQLTALGSGTSGNPITFGAYGVGHKPVINGADLVTGWTLESENVWKATATTEAQAVYFDGVRGTKEDSIGNLDQVREWYWIYNVLYVYSASDPDIAYANPGIEAAVRNIGIDLHENDYITIDGLNLRQIVIWGIKGYGTAQNTDDCDYITVRNCTIQNIGPGQESPNLDAVGIYLGAFADNWIIEDNIVHNIREILEFGTISGAPIYIGNTYYEGALRSRPSNNNIVRRNTLFDCATGITMKYDSIGNTITHNLVYDCDYAGIVSTGNGSAGNTISYNTVYDVDGDGDTAIMVFNHTTVAYNIICDSYNGIFIQAITSDYENNMNSGDSNLIYNNVLVDNQEGILLWNDGAPKAVNNVIKNNIVAEGTFGRAARLVHVRDKDDISDNTFDYNCYYDPGGTLFRVEDAADGYKTFSEWQTATGQDSHSIMQNPQFNNSISHDFAPKSISPCIDAGLDVGLTEDFIGTPIPQGGGFDIGAYEYKEDSNQLAPPAGFRVK